MRTYFGETTITESSSSSSSLNTQDTAIDEKINETNYLSEFYYLDSSSSDLAYSYEAKGSLNVDRFFQNKPAWQALSVSDIKKPKTLILADWRAPKWDIQQIKSVQKNITYLLSKEFVIYAWQSGNLKSLNKNKVHLLGDPLWMKAMTPVSATKLIELANHELGLTSDEIHILDDYWLDYLEKKPDTLPLRQLNISDLWKHNNKDKYKGSDLKELIAY